MDQDRCQFFHQDLSKHHKTKINEGHGKLSVAQKFDPAPKRKLHCSKIDDISLIFYESCSSSSASTPILIRTSKSFESSDYVLIFCKFYVLILRSYFGQPG